MSLSETKTCDEPFALSSKWYGKRCKKYPSPVTPFKLRASPNCVSSFTTLPETLATLDPLF